MLTGTPKSMVKGTDYSRRKRYQRERLTGTAREGYGGVGFVMWCPAASPGSLPRVSLGCHGDNSSSGIPPA